MPTAPLPESLEQLQLQLEARERLRMGDPQAGEPLLGLAPAFQEREWLGAGYLQADEAQSPRGAAFQAATYPAEHAVEMLEATPEVNFSLDQENLDLRRELGSLRQGLDAGIARVRGLPSIAWPPSSDFGGGTKIDSPIATQMFPPSDQGEPAAHDRHEEHERFQHQQDDAAHPLSGSGAQADKVGLLAGHAHERVRGGPRRHDKRAARSEGEVSAKVQAEVRSVLGRIALPRVQQDGSLHLSYNPEWVAQWDGRSRRRPESVGLEYCCWRHPLIRSDLRHWCDRFLMDLLANAAYLLVAVVLWMQEVHDGVWEWWILEVGVLLGLAVTIKNVINFHHEISPLLSLEHLPELILEAVDQVKFNLAASQRIKDGAAEMARGGAHGRERCSRLCSEGGPSSFGREPLSSEALCDGLDEAAEEARRPGRLAKLPPWICQSRLRFVCICASPLFLIVLIKGAVDHVHWPRVDADGPASYGLPPIPPPYEQPIATLEPSTLPPSTSSPATQEYEPPSPGSYPCWSTVCTAVGDEGFCLGTVYFARKYVRDKGGPMTMLKDVQAGVYGPFAKLTTHGDYLCHAIHKFPPVNYTMHCICDYVSPQERRLQGVEDDAAPFGFKVLLGNIVLNAVIAALASWPVVRWFSNFSLAHMEQALWMQLDLMMRQSFDDIAFQTTHDIDRKIVAQHVSHDD